MKIDGAFEALVDFTAQYKHSITIVMGLDLMNDVVARDIAIFSLSPNKLYSTVSVLTMLSRSYFYCFFFFLHRI